MRSVLVIFCLAIAFPSLGQGAGNLVVVVDNIKHEEGVLQVAIFDNEDSYLKDAREIKTVRVDKTGTTELTFESLPFGKYSLSIFHDLNENVELDTNFMGIPKEPFGFSNNAMGAFGPPGFEKASVLISGDEQTTQIKLKSF